MFDSLSRRDFVTDSLRAGALVSLGDFAFLRGLPPVSAADVKLANTKVQVHADIEPLVRLIEDTPRNQLLEAVAEKLRQDVGYQQLLAALFLAGVRSIQPRPVGFKFHAVLVVNSAHLASLAMPDNDRWLPLFWALDNFKSSQARNQTEGGWVMRPVDEGKVPPSSQAKGRFIEAMDNWDEEGADRAIVGLARSAGAGEIIELFWRYGARDFRDIGHKAIYAANSWRTLQTIGWRHAEPVLRSLAYALLEHHEKDVPSKLDAEPDRPWRDNLGLAAKIRPEWERGKLSPEATTDLLQALRGASPSGSCEQVVKQLNGGIDPASVWDALFLRAGELLMQQPGIVGIHCVTSANALHFAYLTSGHDETRRMMMLQAAAFLSMFQKFMTSRGQLRQNLHVETLEREPVHNAGAGAIDEILTDISKDRMTAARKALALAENPAADPHALMLAARRLVFNKGNDSHDYKFSSAALEDYYHTTPHWRARYLATSMFNLKGAGDRDNGLIGRARAALGKT
jgi:hypothetical protein